MSGPERGPRVGRVHPTAVEVASVELTPPHAERVETEAYRRARHFLIEVHDTPCYICGIRRSQGGAMEAHHHPIERSLISACDPVKVHRDYPQVYDRETLDAFADSPANLVVICATHHRDPEHGIHHLTAPDWMAQKYLTDGYVVAARPQDAAFVAAQDEQLTTPLTTTLAAPPTAVPSAAREGSPHDDATSPQRPGAD